jgi:hypothetical protein
LEEFLAGAVPWAQAGRKSFSKSNSFSGCAFIYSNSAVATGLANAKRVWKMNWWSGNCKLGMEGKGLPELAQIKCYRGKAT